MNAYLTDGDARRSISDADLALFAQEDGHDYGVPEALRAASSADNHDLAFETWHDEHNAEHLDSHQHGSNAPGEHEARQRLFEYESMKLAQLPLLSAGDRPLDASQRYDTLRQVKHQLAADDDSLRPTRADMALTAVVDEIASDTTRDLTYQEPEDSDLTLGEQADLQFDLLTGRLKGILGEAF